MSLNHTPYGEGVAAMYSCRSRKYFRQGNDKTNLHASYIPFNNLSPARVLSTSHPPSCAGTVRVEAHTLNICPADVSIEGAIRAWKWGCPRVDAGK